MPQSFTAPHAPIDRSAYQPLMVVLGAVCVGIVAERVADFSLTFWWPLALGAWGGWWWLWRGEWNRLAVLPLLIALAATAAAWQHCRWSLYDETHLGLFARDVAGPTAVEARAVSGSRRIPAPPYDPLRTMVTPTRTRLEIEITAIRDDDVWRSSSGAVTLFVDGDLVGIEAGDRLRIFGQLATMSPPANPGEFNFAQQARVSRHLCRLHTEFPECVTRLAPASPWTPARWFDFLRTRGDRLLWQNLGPQRAGLASAMFLGSREELQADEAQAFMETGTIHLLVISGLNVGILAGCLFLLMRLLLVPRGWSLALVSVVCVLYAATTDAQPPVVRATVMVLVYCAATMLGRRALAFNTIAAAALVVLAINPAELFQTGTQLSFLSVGVLAWSSQLRLWPAPTDPLDRLIARTRPWHERSLRLAGRELGRTVLVSLAIWLVICPLVMARFHLVSPVAVVLGPMLGIPVTLAMGSGFGIFAFGWIAPFVSGALGWLCDMNLAFMESCVDATRAWRGNHFWVTGPADWWLAGFYGALACWIFVPRLALPRRWCVALLAGWIALGLGSPLWSSLYPGERLQCTFLSVGHGTAVVLELPGGKTMLYDAGRLGSPSGASRAVAGYLWSRGITHLDAVVLSHADADHYNALPELLDRFSVGVVYISPMMFEDRTPALDALHAAIDGRQVPVREVWGGDRLRTGSSAAIEVLHPPQKGVLGTDNANSIVLTVEYEGRRLLLTGDLESPGLDDVLAEEPYDCDVLLTPHHGSAFSDPPGFADWSTPEWAIVSGGQRDRVELVETAYASRGSQVLHTATSGAVQVAIADGRISVDRWHQVSD